MLIISKHFRFSYGNPNTNYINKLKDSIIIKVLMCGEKDHL